MGKVSDTTFGYVKPMLSAAFNLFHPLLQTKMYDSEEDKRSLSPSLQNAIGNEPSLHPCMKRLQTICTLKYTL